MAWNCSGSRNKYAAASKFPMKRMLSASGVPASGRILSQAPAAYFRAVSMSYLSATMAIWRMSLAEMSLGTRSLR